MFRNTEDPSSGSLVQLLDKNYKNHSCNFYPSTVQGSLMMDDESILPKELFSFVITSPRIFFFRVDNISDKIC